MSRKRKRVTLRDVARHAGVSPTAVSFAYNAPHQLSHTTREHILDTAESLGYQPHPVARTLATGRTNAIGLLVATSLNWMLHDPLFTHFLGEVGAACDREEKRIVLASMHESWRHDSRQGGEAVAPITWLASIAADGFLMFSINRAHPLAEAVQRSLRPIVLLDSADDLQAPTFNIDDRGGAYAAAQHLLAKGHRQFAIATMTPRRDGVVIPSIERRVQAFSQAVEEAGLPPTAVQIVHARGVPAAGHQSFQNIWNLRRRPTAVFCVSDVRALGILSGARREGISVPDDLAVVGFGDLPDASVSSPPLTTVHRDMDSQPQLAIRTLFQLINEQISEADIESPHISETRLVVRESS
ncbi:MAG: LacI family DNA-binding transcriptional regulator [Caldilineaceae bacterium]|nr:LacI family DNA-binding transcriptional regulator [Caldilineaceae bacterium]